MSVGGRIDTVVFDLGGVLIDWNPRYLYRKIFESEDEMEFFLTEICTPEWNYQMDRGVPFDDAVAQLSSEHPEYAEQIEAYRDRWPEMLGGPIEETEETVSLLPALQERGYSLYALTNFSAETFPVALQRYDFLGYFEHILVSGEVGLAKPEAEIYALLVESTGLNPVAAVFIDDSAANVEAAVRLGFEGLIFRGAEELQKDLTRLGISLT